MVGTSRPPFGRKTRASRGILLKYFMRVIEQERLIKSINDFDRIEREFSITFPDFLKSFLLQFEGAFVDDTCYNGKETFKDVLNVYKHEHYASVEEILKGHKVYGIEGFIPFAIDSGGWDYNVSIKPDTYGQVWVNKFNSGDEDTMTFVAPSFEEFIRELKPED